jgi:Spy/CpxP family protein refolding chaperone
MFNGQERTTIMRPWIKRTLFGLFGASLLFGAFAAGAWRGHHHGWASMSDEDAAKVKARVVEKVGRRLDLDEAQKAKLGVLADRVREQRRALAGPAGDPRAEIAALVAGPTFDRAKAQAFVESKTQAVGAGSPQVIAALGDFYDSLNPEQQAKLRAFMERRGHHGPRG